jgi:hypothetical protein
MYAKITAPKLIGVVYIFKAYNTINSCRHVMLFHHQLYQGQL